MLESIERGNAWLNGYVWGVPMIALLMGTGLVLTFVTRAAQFQNRCLTASVPPDGAGREEADHTVGIDPAQVSSIEEHLLASRLRDLGKKRVARLEIQ